MLPQPPSMTSFLGEGRCSLVVRIQSHLVLELQQGSALDPAAVQFLQTVPVVALRFFYQHHQPAVEATVAKHLRQYLPSVGPPHTSLDIPDNDKVESDSSVVQFMIEIAVSPALTRHVLEALLMDNTRASHHEKWRQFFAMDGTTESMHGAIQSDLTEPPPIPLSVAAVESDDVDANDTTAAATWDTVTYEIKPKAVQRLLDADAVVGIRLVNDGDGTVCEEVLLSAVKRLYCRFSLKQRHDMTKQPTVHTTISAYCPNGLLHPAATADSIASALRALRDTPQSYLRCLAWNRSSLPVPCETRSGHETPVAPSADPLPLPPLLPDEHLSLLTAILSGEVGEDLLQRITSLQSGALDIELLAAWERWQGTTMTSLHRIEWLRVGKKSGTMAPEDAALSCYCATPGRIRNDAAGLEQMPASWERASCTFSEAKETFYIATTAKDCSIILSLRYRVTGAPTQLDVSPHSSFPPSSSSSTRAQCVIANDVRRELSHHSGGGRLVRLTTRSPAAVDVENEECCGRRNQIIGVARLAVVDIDCKRHKSLSHYFKQDAEIVRCGSV